MSYLGCWELIVVSTLASFLSGLGIIQRVQRERRVLRIVGYILLSLGSAAIVAFFVALFYQQIIRR
jgi:hypothetical protein